MLELKEKLEVFDLALSLKSNSAAFMSTSMALQINDVTIASTGAPLNSLLFGANLRSRLLSSKSSEVIVDTFLLPLGRPLGFPD